MSARRNEYRYKSTANDAWLWPLVVTAVMLVVAFIPALGLVNLLLFVPLGIYLAALGARYIPLMVVGVSVALEIAQFVLATGSSDLTDVIVNAVGALIGLGLFALLRPRLPALVWALGGANLIAIVAIAVYTRSFPTMPPGGGVTIT